MDAARSVFRAWPSSRLALGIAAGLLAFGPAACPLPSRAAPAEAGPQAELTRLLEQDPAARAEWKRFERLLAREGVADVVPSWQLWRQGTDWRGCQEPAFAVPPRERWPGMVRTLALLRDLVIPKTGPVDVVSGFRTARYNRCAKGASKSRHLDFDALDVVPRRRWARDELHATLLEVWRREGKARRFGLGLYAGVRFHVDGHRYRRW